MMNNSSFQRFDPGQDQTQPLRELVLLETRDGQKITLWVIGKALSSMNRIVSDPPTTHTDYNASTICLPLHAAAGETRSVGYYSAVAPALEGALANAHEAGHERAVRILHAVLAILDDPRLR
jgi:hypothetical protein